MHSEAAESFKEEEQKLMLGTRAEAKPFWRPECQAKNREFYHQHLSKKNIVGCYQL